MSPMFRITKVTELNVLGSSYELTRTEIQPMPGHEIVQSRPANPQGAGSPRDIAVAVMQFLRNDFALKLFRSLPESPSRKGA